MEKCKACGYDNSYSFELGKRIGNENFIRINGKFTTEIESYHNNIKPIYLFGCTKCYTVSFRT